MRCKTFLFLAAFGSVSSGLAMQASTTLPAAILDAVADSHRPPEQSRLDGARKPAEAIAFAGIKQGDTVADFMPGNGYFTRILSRVVGPRGRVYAFTPTEQIKHCKPAETAGSRALAHDPAYHNIVAVSAPVNWFSVPRELDVIWTAQNYHDLHDAFLGPADVKRVDAKFFEALKVGGVLMVIDHAAMAGSGVRDTETLHRIDPSSVRDELELAGFVFAGELDELRNRADDHTLPVFDPRIRGRTDQFIYIFRKP